MLPLAFAALLAVSDAVAAIMLAADLLVVCVSVALRYWFNAPVEWSDDVARGLMVGSSFFGAASALARGDNPGVRFFVDLVPASARAVIDSVAALLMAVIAGYVAINALKLGIEKSQFRGREDTDKLIAALEGLEMKEGDDFPQGDKTLRKDDHQAFLRQFIFEIKDGKSKILQVIEKDKTIFPPSCKFV